MKIDIIAKFCRAAEPLYTSLCSVDLDLMPDGNELQNFFHEVVWGWFGDATRAGVANAASDTWWRHGSKGKEDDREEVVVRLPS